MDARLSNKRYNKYKRDKEANEFYHSDEWRAVRPIVFQRDHYLCQVCKRKGIINQGNTIHHITPLREDWSRRLDIDNLETICAACHNKEHPEKGYSQHQKDSVHQAKKMGAVLFKRNPEL